MADTGWWAEEIDPGQWSPMLMLRNGLTLHLPAWFATEDECVHFIREHLAEAGMLPLEP